MAAGASTDFDILVSQVPGGGKDIFDYLAENIENERNAPVMTAAPEESVFTSITRPVREFLSPILGPSEEQVMHESIPVVQPDGLTRYQYKPLGDRFQQEGLLAPIVKTEDVIADIPVLAPQEDDGAWTSAARGLGRGAVGVANSLTSPAGIPLLASGAAEVNAIRGASAGVPTLRSATVLESAIPAVNRAAAGGFAASMIPTIPEQVSGLYNSQNAGEAVERTIGLAGTGLGVVGGTIAARSPRHAQAEIARQSDLPATAEVLQRQGDEEILLTRTPDIFDQLANETEETSTIGTVTPEEQATDALIAQNAEGTPIVEPAVASDVPVSEVNPFYKNKAQRAEILKNFDSKIETARNEGASLADDVVDMSKDDPETYNPQEWEGAFYVCGDIFVGKKVGDESWTVDAGNGKEATESTYLDAVDTARDWLGYDAAESAAKMSTGVLNEQQAARAELIDKFTPPAGWKIEDSIDSVNGSNYWILRDPSGEKWKISLRDHEPSDPRQKEFGVVDSYVLVDDAKNPYDVAKGLDALEEKMQLISDKRFPKTPETQTNKPNETNTIPEIDIPATEPGPDLVQDARENPQSISQEERNQTVEQVAERGVTAPAPVETYSIPQLKSEGFTRRDPSDVRIFKADKITRDSLTEHLAKNGYKPGDVIVTPNGEAEIYTSKTGIAYSWKPKTGAGRDGLISEPKEGVVIHPTKWVNPQTPAISRLAKTEVPSQITVKKEVSENKQVTSGTPLESSQQSNKIESDLANSSQSEIAPTAEEGASLVNETPVTEQLGGPGAANIQEFAETPVRTTSLSNAQTNAERAARGELPLMLEETQSNQSTFDQAEKILEANPNAGRDTVVRILEGDKPQISEIDEGILAHEKIRLENEKQMEADRASDLNTSEIEREQAAKRWEELELQQTQLDQAVRRAGTIAGRALQFRQRQIRDDFTLSAMEQKTRVAKGRPLTPEESAEIKTQADEIAAQQAKVDESAARVEQQEREKALETTITQLKEKLKTKAPTLDKRVLDYATKIVEGWKTEADKARLRMMQRAQTSFGAGLDQDTLVDLTIIARARIGEGLLNAGNFAKELVAEYGEFVRPYAQQAWDAAQEQLNNIGKELPKVVREKVKKAIVTTPEAIVNRITETMKTRLAEGGDLSNLKGLVDRLALEFVRKGINTREPLLDAVHAVLEPLIPDLQKQQTSDLISGYGQFKTLDKEAAKVTLRGLKGELQQIAKIQDMQAKLAPKKTGIERRTPTTEERALIRQVNDLKNKGGFEVTDPEQQLKTALGAIQTRLRNEIDDFDNAILNKEPIVRENGKIDYDDETKALQVQRDAKKSEYDELFPKQPATEEQQLATALKSLDRSISELQNNIKEGKLYSTSKRNTLTSPELTAKRAELESLREDRQLLRDLDTARIEAQKEAQLLKAIDDLESGRKQPNTGVDTVESKRITELRDQLQKLRDARDETPEARQRQIDKALVIAKASLEDANKRLEGGATSRAGKEPLRSDELDNIRMERDAVNAAIRVLQEAAKPKKTPEEIRLQFRKSVIARRAGEFERRLAAGEFETKKLKPVELDEEGKKAEVELEKIKERFQRARYEDYRSKRSIQKKIWDGIKATATAGINIVSSADFSGFRQALGAILSNVSRTLIPLEIAYNAEGKLRPSVINPVRSANLIFGPTGKMFSGWLTEDRAKRIELAREKRPNAKSGAYKEMGIQFSDLKTHNFTKYEENAHSVLDDWAQTPFKSGSLPKTVITAPAKAGANVVRMSNRAFITLLNELRADLADYLLDINYKDREPSLNELKVIGNLVNVATGRGKLNPAVASALGKGLWAPSLLTSRIQGLTGQPIWGGDPWKNSVRARGIAAKEYARIIASGYLLWQVSKLFDEKDEQDPTSSDYGKIVRGDTRIDPWGGYQQVAVLGARAGTGEIKSLDGKVRDSNLGSLIANFGRSKLRPDWGALWNAYDIYMDRVQPGHPDSVGGVIQSMVTPMSLGNVVDVMRDRGFSEGMIINALGAFGAGVGVYDSEDKAVEKQK